EGQWSATAGPYMGRISSGSGGGLVGLGDQPLAPQLLADAIGELSGQTERLGRCVGHQEVEDKQPRTSIVRGCRAPVKRCDFDGAGEQTGQAGGEPLAYDLGIAF